MSTAQLKTTLFSNATGTHSSNAKSKVSFQSRAHVEENYPWKFPKELTRLYCNRKCSDRISVGISAIMTEDFCCFAQ
jgi:hypothetical protein